MPSDPILLPLSALQHLLYCERQCALIHIERLWAENRHTVEGRQLHERADGGKPERRPGLRIARAVPLRSLALGLIGVADVVEFHPNTTFAAPGVPFPVEYKRGRPKKHLADHVQLAAQAMCLEEMLSVPVPAGALFYGQTRRRLDVPIDEHLRTLVRETAARLHALINAGVTPPARRDEKCDRCSLLNLCMPGAIAASGKSACRYVARTLHHALTHAPSTEKELA